MADEVTYYTTDDTGAYVETALPTFQDSIPEELRDSEHIKGYGDAGELARAYVDLKSNAPEVPETADGYTLPEIPEARQRPPDQSLRQMNACYHTRTASMRWQLFRPVEADWIFCLLYPSYLSTDIRHMSIDDYKAYRLLSGI